jgi:membrane protein
MLWVYLAWVIVLLGAVIAAYAPSLQMRVARRRPGPGYRFELALALLQALRGARDDGRRGLTLTELAGALRVDPLQLEPLLELLVSLDWLALLAEDGAGRHVLLADPRTTPAAPLLDALLLPRAPATQAFRRRTALDELKLADLLG